VRWMVSIPQRFEVANNNRHATHFFISLQAAKSSIQLAVELVHLRSVINQYSRQNFIFKNEISTAAQNVNINKKTINNLFFICSR
jgi:hypothetical protein